jgi:glucosamine--fructose-6-phosphate aminotransferase (isomerizing)
MNSHFSHTYQEILSQPKVWSAALQIINAQFDQLNDFFRRGAYTSILFTGCGSTYYLSLAGASLMQELAGISTYGLPASEVWLNRSAIKSTHGRNLLVAVSRSGETTETIRACEIFKQRKLGDILGVSCYPGSSLTQLGETNLVFPDSREESVAQTRSFSTLYLACVALGIIAGGKTEDLKQLVNLPEACNRLLDHYQEQALSIGQEPELERFYFLGSGLRYGLASELSLKMKEMSLSHSEPFHFLEFRHGPKSMVNTHTLIIGLLSGTQGKFEKQVLDEMKAHGARVISLGDREAEFNFQTNLPEAMYSPLYLPFGQLVAYSRAINRGLNPDQPTNLSAVVKLE